LDECRVRICLTHNHSDYELTQIIHTIIRCAKSVGVTRKDASSIAEFSTTDYNEPREQALWHKNRALAQIMKIIEEVQTRFTAADEADRYMKKDALNLMRKFGFGACSVRTINGTFLQHLDLEEYIGSLHHGLACLHLYDKRIASFSVIQALARPLNGMKVHTIILPAQTNNAVEEGIHCIRRSRMVALQKYESHGDMLSQVSACPQDQSAITVIIRASAFSNSSEVETLFETVRSNAKNAKAVTIMIDALDMGAAAAFIGIPCQVNLKTIATTHDIRVLLLGAFYDNFRLPGAYVVSDPHLVNEFRFAAPGTFLPNSSPRFETNIAFQVIYTVPPSLLFLHI